jgi:hypothetical protein
MSLNINTIIGKFNQLANTHPLINSFGYGPIYDLDGYPDMEYAYLWVRNDNSHTLVYSEDNKYQAVEFQFILRVGDKVNNQPNVFKANGENSNNGLTIIKDTFRILLDILNSIMMNTLGLFNDLELVNDVDIEPFFHEDTGDVNGHQATITLRIKNDNKCVSPLNA